MKDMEIHKTKNGYLVMHARSFNGSEGVMFENIMTFESLDSLKKWLDTNDAKIDPK